MFLKLKRKLKRTVKRWLRSRSGILAVTILLFAISTIIYASYMQNQRLTVDPATLKPLLSLIAKGESSGNYNAYFGHGSNTSIDFTKMSIADVQKWQAKYVQQGSASSAVGKYQIVDTTLSGLVQRLGIDTKQKFDQRMQDKLAIALIERRG